MNCPTITSDKTRNSPFHVTKLSMSFPLPRHRNQNQNPNANKNDPPLWTSCIQANKTSGPKPYEPVVFTSIGVRVAWEANGNQNLSEETRAGAKETAFHTRLRQGMLMEG